jgi:oxygen-dependent protoporphyrinogen oxidase
MKPVSSSISSGDHMRVVIVGGGIAGLSIAHALRATTPTADVIVLEGSDRIGGYVRSDRIDGYLCESGPDGFLDNAPATLAFARDLGLSPRLLQSHDEARRRYIFRAGRLHEVPLSVGAFARTRLLSLRSKLRIAGEPFTGPPPHHDETIRQFAERHIGREAAHVLVGSMVSGIFAGDADQLSLRSCFPKMYEMDAEHRSLFRAMLAKRRERRNQNGIGAPAGRLTSFVGGMEELVREAAASLGPIVRTSQRVMEVQVRFGRSGTIGPRLVGARTFSLTSNGHRIEADAVVFAGGSHETARLLQPLSAHASGLLNGISAAPLAVVCLGYDEAALAATRGPLNGFGFLVPRGEGPRILGALWETSIYDGRAPRGKALIRVMIGGATDPHAVALADTELLDVVRTDLERTMGLRLAPELVHIVRHRRGIPQYTTGHASRLARIDAALAGMPGMFLAGNSYRGVSINACVEDAPRVAARVSDHLRSLEHRSDYALAR